jgi:hypothetical protein
MIPGCPFADDAGLGNSSSQNHAPAVFTPQLQPHQIANLVLCAATSVRLDFIALPLLPNAEPAAPTAMCGGLGRAL